MKQLKNHFECKTTYIVGNRIVNGCVCCTIEEFEDVCKKHRVPESMKMKVINLYHKNQEEQENWNELVNDEDWFVRTAVAQQGYGLEQLVNDKNWFVRKAVANYIENHKNK